MGNKKYEPGIEVNTSGVFTSKVVVAVSTNVESSCKWIIPASVRERVQLGPNHKVMIDRLVFVPKTQQNPVAVFRITIDGREIDIPADHDEVFAAGSTVNVGTVLKVLGVDGVGLVGTVGCGEGADTLKAGLEGTFNRQFLMRARGTSRTFTVRDPCQGESVLFCLKETYEPSAEALNLFESIGESTIVVVSGVKPMDMSTVTALYRSGAGKRVFMPHLDLLKRDEDREGLLQLLERTDLLQVNRYEASMLLKSDIPSSPEVAGPMALRLLELGPRAAIITMGKDGAVYAEQQGKGSSFQPAFPVEKVADTSGPGDAHLATFLFYRWLYSTHTLSPEECLEMAARVASHKVAHVGPWSGIPNDRDREDMLVEILAKREGKKTAKEVAASGI